MLHSAHSRSQPASQLPGAFQHLGQPHNSQPDPTDGQIRKENVRRKDVEVEKEERGKGRGDEQEKTFQREYNQPLSPWAGRQLAELKRGDEQKSSFVFPHNLLEQRIKAAALFSSHIHFHTVLLDSELISTAPVCNPVQQGPRGDWFGRSCSNDTCCIM